MRSSFSAYVPFLTKFRATSLPHGWRRSRRSMGRPIPCHAKGTFLGPWSFTCGFWCPAVRGHIVVPLRQDSSYFISHSRLQCKFVVTSVPKAQRSLRRPGAQEAVHHRAGDWSYRGRPCRSGFGLAAACWGFRPRRTRRVILRPSRSTWSVTRSPTGLAAMTRSRSTGPVMAIRPNRRMRSALRSPACLAGEPGRTSWARTPPRPSSCMITPSQARPEIDGFACAWMVSSNPKMVMVRRTFDGRCAVI